MLKFRPSNLAYKRANINLNELQLVAIIEKAINDNAMRGFLYKRSSANSKWRPKWFLLYQNMLFYFDLNPTTGNSERPNQSASACQLSNASSWLNLARGSYSTATATTTSATTNTTPTGGSRSCSGSGSQREPSPSSSSCHSTPSKVRGAGACGPPDESSAGRRFGSLLVPRRRTARQPAEDQPSACGTRLTVSSPQTKRRASCLAAPNLRHQDHQQQQNLNPNFNHSGAWWRQRLASDPAPSESELAGLLSFARHDEQPAAANRSSGPTKASHNLANFLLTTKIGLILLEGSYCERLVEARFGSVASPKQHQASNTQGNKTEDNSTSDKFVSDCELERIFTLSWAKRGSKEYQFRAETEVECRTWAHAIGQARYSSLMQIKEQLEQKYLHLSQIVESESTAKWQYSRQCEELALEVQKLREEICKLKRQEGRTGQLRLVLSKSAAVIESILQRQPSAAKQEPPSTLKKDESSSSQVKQQASSNNRPASAQFIPDFNKKADQQQLQLARARSMDHEQYEHELTLRRARRLGLNQRRDHEEEKARDSLSEIMQRQRQRHKLQPASTFGGLSGEPALSSISFDQNYNTIMWQQREALDKRLALVGSRKQQVPVHESATTGSEVKKQQDCSGQLKQLQVIQNQVVSKQPSTERQQQQLSNELRMVVRELNRKGILLSDCLLEEMENQEEIRKIKKVQGFFRGWLCRRRWKQIVQEYIKSPHAESMRKRNNLVFRLVECEEEYVGHLQLLITAFLRPFKMAASSSRPALNHDELNSIFLNSETLLFLHQIFLKGLMARMESWPTLIMGDLFSMLLPMLSIYQEYVRNHHFSLQVLAECKQRESFCQMLSRLEERPQLNGRTLEIFLIYPMHQIPRYIIFLHEILAHTPHNHVERRSLYEAQTELEHLSRQMHDEVSETENLRQNLAIERMIIGGCDLLLDVNQGVLNLVFEEPLPASGKRRKSCASKKASKQPHQQQQHQHQLQLQQKHKRASTFSEHWHQQQAQFSTGSLLSDHLDWRPNGDQASTSQFKELRCQCFLFTNTLLLGLRGPDGKLQLLENIGRISLSDVTLIENPLEYIIHNHIYFNNDGAFVEQQAANSSGQSRKRNRQPEAEIGAAKAGGGFTGTEPAESLHTGAQAESIQSTKVASGGAPFRQYDDEEFVDKEQSTLVRHSQQQAAHTSAASSVRPASRIAGFLASKILYLTGGGGSGAQSSQQAPVSKTQQHKQPQTHDRGDLESGGGDASSKSQASKRHACSSAPPSPINGVARRRKLCNPQEQRDKLDSGLCQVQNGDSTGGTLGGAAAKCVASSWFQGRNFGPCDFVLLLDKQLSGADYATTATSIASYQTGPGGCSTAASTLSLSNCNTSLAPIGAQRAANFAVHLVAPNVQEKAAWMSDISQCIDNVHFNDLYQGSVPESTSYTTQHVRSDPRLYKDDIDIKFSRALNSCKLPQIRYATKDRLFERLFDLRFLSIDFLNTFLLTYRVFTTAEDIMDTLLRVYGTDSFRVRAQRIQEERDRMRLCHHSGSSKQTGNSPSPRLESLAQSQQAINEIQSQPHQIVPQTSANQAPVLQELHDASSNEQVNKFEHRKPPRPSVPARLSLSSQRDSSSSSQQATLMSTTTGQQPIAVSPKRSPEPASSGSHLLLPRGHDSGASQKRRSTISALSPITGSNASSMLNMSIAVDQAAGSLSRLALNDQELDFDNLSLASSRHSACSLAHRIRTGSVVPGEGPPSISRVLLASQQLQSSSMQTLDTQQGRQVRANSMSQLANVKENGQPIANGANCQHWRLCYRKNHQQKEENSPSNTFLSPSLALKQRRASSSDAYQKAGEQQAEQGRQLSGSSSGRALNCSEFKLRLDLVSPNSTSSLNLERDRPAPPPSPCEPAANDKKERKSVAVPSKSRAAATDEKPAGSKSKTKHKREVHSPECSSSSSYSSSSSSGSSSGSSSTSSPDSKRNEQSRSESGSGLLASDASLSSEEHHKSPPCTQIGRRKRANSLKRLSMKEIDLVAARNTDTSADEDEHELQCELEESSTPPEAIDSTGNEASSSGSSVSSRGLRQLDKALRKSLEANKLRVDKRQPVKLQEVSCLESSKQDSNLIKRRAERKESLKQTSVDGPNAVADQHSVPPRQVKQVNQRDGKSTSGAKKQMSLDNDSQPASGRLPALATKANGSVQSKRAGNRQESARSSCQLSALNALPSGGNSRVGVIVSGSSPRLTSRRSSNSSAASAFAVATAASDNPLLVQPPPQSPLVTSQQIQHQQQQQNPHQHQHQLPQPQYSPSVMREQIFFNQRSTGGTNSRCSQQAANSSVVFETNSSLCNSRASSRLSSSADLDLNSSQHSQVATASYASNASTSYVQHSQIVGRVGAGSAPSITARLGAASQASISISAASMGQTSTAKAVSQQHDQQQQRSQVSAFKRHSATSQLPMQMQEQAQKHSVKTLATMRVLAVLRHWISKHSQDFLTDERLADVTLDFLKEIFADSRHYLQSEQYSALHVLVTLEKVLKSARYQVDLDLLLAPPTRASPDSIETLSALEIAEGMTHLDHKIFQAIRSDEFLDQAWMKLDKAMRAPHILLITKRFNDVSRLVASEIIRVPDLHRRVAVIEKWTNVAHICRVLHNFNGVLQICAAFTNSAVFRLKKTWDKISKTTRTTIDQLQSLVSTDSKFRNMRDAINRCDPPSIPYVGMYLTDLSFIEEGSPDLSQEGLLNFSKLRMIAHVIREIQHLQKGNYKIELSHRVANYLLDGSRHLQDDEMYRCSLAIEPRSSSGKSCPNQLITSAAPTTSSPITSGGGSQQQQQSCNSSTNNHQTHLLPNQTCTPNSSSSSLVIGGSTTPQTTPTLMTGNAHFQVSL